MTSSWCSYFCVFLVFQFVNGIRWKGVMFQTECYCISTISHTTMGPIPTQTMLHCSLLITIYQLPLGKKRFALYCPSAQKGSVMHSFHVWLLLVYTTGEQIVELSLISDTRKLVGRNCTAICDRILSVAYYLSRRIPIHVVSRKGLMEFTSLCWLDMHRGGWLRACVCVGWGGGQRWVITSLCFTRT